MDAVNRLELSARLLEREALRYSPAGLPICQTLVEHESQQRDGGEFKTVRLVLAARFSGELALRVAVEALGAQLMITGFLGAKRLYRDNKPSGSLQLHVVAYRIPG